MDAQGGASGVNTARLQTDQLRETVTIHKPTWLEGATFWTVTDSTRHWSIHHDTFTAALVLGCRGHLRAKWHSRGEERAITGGDVQLMMPGEAHRTTAVSEPASFFVLWWTPEAMAQAALELGVSEEVQFRRPQLDDSPAQQPLGRLHDAVNAGATRLEIEHYYLESTASLLAHAGDRHVVQRGLARCHPGVRRAVALMHDSFAESLSLDELSREARVSKFHLARCFREGTGLAPHQYQKLLRLQAARRLIEKGATVEDAAWRSGFADAPHLTRHFRRWLGVSPGQWARASRLVRAV